MIPINSKLAIIISKSNTKKEKINNSHCLYHRRKTANLMVKEMENMKSMDRISNSWSLDKIKRFWSLP